MKDIITKEHVFPHSIDKVWNAISKEEEISAWFVKADFKAEEGYRYSFSSLEKECPAITGVVKTASPYTLIYSWIVEGTSTETIVKWVLEKSVKGTKLYLEHSGISKYPEDSAVTLFNSFDEGWDDCVKNLTQYLTQEVHAG